MHLYLCYQSTESCAQVKERSAVLQERGWGLLEWFLWARASSHPSSERPQEGSAGAASTVGAACRSGCLNGLSTKCWESTITSGLGDFWWKNLVSSGQRVGGWPWWGGDAGEGDWFMFVGVNYLVDADELGRDLKIYKDFVMGIYLHTYSVIDQNGITRHPDSIDSFRYVNGVCTRNGAWYAGGIFPFIFIFLSP